MHTFTIIPLLIAIFLTFFASSVSAEEKPQWPLKTSRTLITDEQIQHARALIRDNTSARKILDEILKDADYWAGLSDERLRSLLPGPEVPRGFDLCTKGCPVHGKEVFRFGTYPWNLDRERPFIVKCPVGGEEYPSNDFSVFLRSGLKDRSSLTGDYPDDGWGWTSPEGDKYWFVAHACHWQWSRNWIPAVQHLSQAYTLTGDSRYAHKCIVMLDRIAECYPAFDHARQSRYGSMVNGDYPGKIVNHIWETSLFETLVRAYDAVFDALVGPNATSFENRSNDSIRANIDANLLEDGIASIKNGKIRGNWGMHQTALAIAALVRQNGPTEEWFSHVLDYMQNDSGFQWGARYATYNIVSADGMPFETSPGYGSIWIDRLLSIADALGSSKLDLYRDPKVQRMLDAPLDMLCLGRFTPNVGDNGHIRSGWGGPGAGVYSRAYRALSNPRYAYGISKIDSRALNNNLRSYGDLFYLAVSEEARSHVEQPKARLLDDYGLAILNNRADSCAVSMYYGVKAGHGHFDRLGIELFAQDRRISPDLGYPDFMNAFVPGIFSWSKNTISHNTVVVDSQRQKENPHGRALHFLDADRARVIEATGEGTYPQTRCYRRTLLQIDVTDADSYLVDVFRVAGGNTHELSIHGPVGDFTMSGMALPEPQTKGTLAGEDVAYGELYDDPTMSAKDYKGSYGGYSGSGYQHLFNVQRGTVGQAGVAEWKVEGTTDSFLRVRVLPAPSQQLIAADAYVSPMRKTPDVLKYMIARRQGSDLETCFVTIWESFKKTPLIENVRVLNRISDASETLKASSEPVALSIQLTDGREQIVVITSEAGQSFSISGVISTNAFASVIEKRGADVKILLACGGSVISSGSVEQNLKTVIRGSVESVDYRNRSIRARIDSPVDDPKKIVGLWARIFNERRSSMFLITDASQEGNLLGLEMKRDDFLRARIPLEATGEQDLFKSIAPLPWAEELIGMRLLDQDMNVLGGIISMSAKERAIRIERMADVALSAERKESYVGAFGPGDRIEIER